MITLLGGIVSAQLWQRRKLKRVARQIVHEGPLMHAAIRITNDVRGSVDISRMLRISALEVAHTLSIEHCCLSLFRESNKERESVCSCGSSNHEHDIEVALATAIKALEDKGTDRFLSHNYPNRADSQAGLRRLPVFGLPITRDGGSLGGVLLVLSSNPARLWLDSEIQLLLAVAHQLSLSVSHARLFAAKERDSLSDALTGCLNLRGFEMQFEDNFQVAKEHNLPISLVMIDLDLFKMINDDCGHAIGNSALRALAEILLDERISGAIAARVGGDEFALILPSHPLEQALVIAERVRQRVELLAKPEFVCKFTLSIGVASFPLHASSIEGLTAAADKAMYRAKTSGRNRVCAF